MVRNEADIVRVNVLYHLSLGFDRILVLDDGSEDGTDRILRDLSKDPRVRWTREEGEFDQGRVFTRMAREAFREGADWVAPLDADDFWHAPHGSLREVLERSQAAALRVKVLDFVQRRRQKRSKPEALLHMTRKVPEPVVRKEGYEELLGSRKISYIELERVPKVIHCTSPEVAMVKGAHRVGGLDGSVVDSDELVILHAPLRSLENLKAKAASAERRGPEGSTTSGPGWHVRRWRKAQEHGDLDREWAANSYEDNCLDVYGTPHQLIFDPTLRDAVSPFLKESLLKRLLGRPLHLLAGRNRG
jgi:glycosyltransferase involved in cell wall biosynthesis